MDKSLSTSLQQFRPDIAHHYVLGIMSLYLTSNLYAFYALLNKIMHGISIKCIYRLKPLLFGDNARLLLFL